MVVSETDNIFFGLAANGYIGSELQMKTIQAQGIKLQNEASGLLSEDPSDPDRNVNQASSSSSSPSASTSQNKDFLIRPTILIVIAMIMTAGWLYIVFNQINGTYFHERYPGCNKTLNAFELAKDHFGDNVCYGGTLNTLECEFEGGDCVNFNLAFPLCKGENRTDVQKSLSNGKCEKVFMSPDCDFDGGDCCPYDIINNPSFGDGNCDEEMNTEKCGYDNGDCVQYNRDFSECPFDVVFRNDLFGNGECNGGILSTGACGYDDRDCDAFILDYPSCPLNNLSRMPGVDDVVIGNNICDSGIYNTVECGYGYGDCNHGQVGQTVSITEDIASITSFLYFSKAISLDGMTMALGLYRTNEDGSFDRDATGLVKIWRFDGISKKWLQFGNNVVGSEGINIGYSMSFSANGDRVVVFSASGMRVYDFHNTMDEWKQVGQTINSNLEYSVGCMTVDGSRVAMIYSKDEIRIYNVGSSEHNVIEPGVNLSPGRYVPRYTQLKFNSYDGSRLLLRVAKIVTKVYQFNSDTNSKSWTQIGQDIGPASSSASSSISANGSRIAVSSYSTSISVPGQVTVFDYDAMDNTWIPVGEPIKSRLSSDGDGFGYDVDMSSDGNLLLVVACSNPPECQERLLNTFDINKCTAGSIELYIYINQSNQFIKILPNRSSPYKANGNILDLSELSDSAIFGLHFSMNGDGSVLSISGYNVDDRNAFIESYNLDEMFDTERAMD